MNWEHLLICIKSIFPNIDTSVHSILVALYDGILIDKDGYFWMLSPNGMHNFVGVGYLTEAEVIATLKVYKENKSIF